jgi:nucleoside 2-deoxyribosyltransferase
MKVYLASAASNRELNEAIATEVVERGHRCVLPRRPRQVAEPARRLFRADAAAVQDADLVLVVGPDVDVDVAWKAGYARALGKRVVLLCPMFENVCDHAQIADEVVRIDSLDEVGDIVAELMTPTPAGRRAERSGAGGCSYATAP